MSKFIGRSFYTVIALVLVGIGISYMAGAANGTSELYAKVCALDSDSFFVGLFYDGVMFGSLMLAAAFLNFVLILPEVWGVKRRSVLHIALSAVRALMALGVMGYWIYHSASTSIFAMILLVLICIVVVGLAILPTFMLVVSYFKKRDFGDVLLRFVLGFIITVLASFLLPLTICVGLIALGFAIFAWGTERRLVVVEVWVWI